MLVDLQVERINGLQLQAELAKRNITLKVHIVAGRGGVSMARGGLEASAMDFIGTPVDKERLVELIESMTARDAETARPHVGAGGAAYLAPATTDATRARFE